MQKLTFFFLVIMLYSFVSKGQEGKNQIDLTFGYAIPSGDHSSDYATGGLCINLDYKRKLNEHWKLTIGRYSVAYGFDETKYRNNVNAQGAGIGPISSTSWGIAAWNFGAEYHLNKKCIFIGGLNSYSALYPTISFTASAGSGTNSFEVSSKGKGLGINLGLMNEYSISKSGHWFIPIKSIFHLGSITYDNPTVLNKNNGIATTQTGTNVLNYRSLNFSVGAGYRF